MSFSSFIPPIFSDLQAKLADEMAHIIQQYHASIPTGNDIISLSFDLVAEFSQAGKYIRPTFLWAGWLLLAHTDDELDEYKNILIRLGAACELLHSCALIHDDIIDQSALRRQIPTIYKRWEKEHHNRSWRKDAQHFGVCMGILSGDLALSLANSIMMDINIPQLFPIWSAMQCEVVTGQILDITYSQQEVFDEKIAHNINYLKTSSYTFIRPLQLGAGLWNPPPDVMQRLSTIGSNIGAGFQLQDDLIDIFSDPDITGKPQGTDILSGTSTVAFAAAISAAQERGQSSTAHYLSQSLGAITDSQHLANIISIMRELGVQEKLQETIDQYFRQAQEELLQLAQTYHYRNDFYIMVSNIIDYLAHRSY